MSKNVLRTKRTHAGIYYLTPIAAFLLTSSALFALPALAGPEGGQVSAGSGTISQSGTTTTINQQSQNLAINWQSFNVGANESVRFDQPNASSVALNRVLGQSASQIMGNISSNGQVFILNPNGVLFAPGAQVNVGGLVASTLSLSDNDLMNGNFALTNNGATGAVVNKGTLTAAQGGYIALLGPNVDNEGIISATLGTALLAAGDKITLNIDNGSLLSYNVDQGSLQALAENHQIVQADGGHVYMTAKAADALASATVNNTGVIEARTVQNHNGVIELVGDATVGEVHNSGTLDASAATGGTGGKVVATAQHVLLDNGSAINASGKDGGGKVYIGGGWHGADATIANASAVVMMPDATIDVSGGGGEAVLWSQDYTAFGGSIAAKGGNVETSSHGNLFAVGAVDASNWLLDPSDVTIASSAPSGSSFANNFTPTQDSVILNTSINNALNSGNNVTITTGTTGSSAGDIMLNAPVGVTATFADNFNPVLTLQAANNININDVISASDNGRLGVLLTADADGSGVGNVNFAATGQISSFGGDVFIGGSGNYNPTTKGQNVNMAAGSFIDTGGGQLDINVNGTVDLSAESLRVSNTGGGYNLNGSYGGRGSRVDITSAALTTNNTDPTIADILTDTYTYLTVGNIGDVAHPIKIAALHTMRDIDDFIDRETTLTVNSSTGSTYISELANQTFGEFAYNLGDQHNATQNLTIAGDDGGFGHINLVNDNSGVLNIAGGDVVLGGASVYPASLNITKDNTTNSAITFANNAITLASDGSYTPYLSIDAGSMSSVDPSDSIAEMNVVNYLYLTGTNIGTTTADALDVAGGQYLVTNNRGGSTFINVVDDSFSNIEMTNVKDVGTHAIHFSGGDHIDYLSDGNEVYVPTLAATGCATTTTCGMDVTAGNRNITFTVDTGDMEFAHDAVNTGTGDFTAYLETGRVGATLANMILGDNAITTNTFTGESNGNILAANAYNSSSPVAQIVAGDVNLTDNASLDTVNSYVAGTIGAGGKDIQIARNANASVNGDGSNTLTVSVEQGNVTLHELTNHEFKTISTTLNNVSAAQTIKYDLFGPDDVNFTDTGTKVLIDATKVNLSDGNRNWNLYTPSRDLQVDSNSLGTGYYHLDSGQHLKLNSDIITNDGDIELTGDNGIYLMKTLKLDSNSDNASPSGNITINSPVSGTAAGYVLTVDASSADDVGGTIQSNSSFGNGGGAYLAGLTFTSAGSLANGAHDGDINLEGGNYFINGNFVSNGNSNIYTTDTIDTEQGNTASAGNISFIGKALNTYYYYGDLILNASTTATGMNGGNVDLYNTHDHTTLAPGNITVTTTGGTIELPAVSMTAEGATNNQSYTGGIINLHGDLLSGEGGNITLNGDTRIYADRTISTGDFDPDEQTNTAGNISIGGTGISDGGTGHTLTINSGYDSGNSQYNGNQNYTLYAGTIGLKAGNAGGNYLTTITANASTHGTYNDNFNNDITLNNVGTIGNQSYSGGLLNLNGATTTNGGTIDFSGLSSNINVIGDSSIATDRAGGSSDAGLFTYGGTFDGAHSLSIDLTADGGGASRDYTSHDVGSNTPLTSFIIKAKNIIANAITTTGNITLQAAGASSDLTLNDLLTTTSGDITAVAGRNFINNNALDTGFVQGSGRYFVYTLKPDGNIPGFTPTAYTEHYSQSYDAGTTPSYASVGNWFFYSMSLSNAPTPGGQAVSNLPDAGNLVPTYAALIASVTDPLANTPTTSSDAASSATKGTAGVPQIAKETTLLETGSVTVQNGGIHLPDDINTTSNANDE